MADPAWPVVPLGDIAEVSAGVTLGRKLPAYGTVELPYLRVANVQDGYLDLRDVKTVRVRPAEVDRYRLQPGDVLMNEGGDYDKLGRGTVWHGEISTCLRQNHVFRVRANHSRLLPAYLAAVADSALGRRHFLVAGKQSTNLASIGSSEIKALPVPLPSRDEQRAITRALGAFDAALDVSRRIMAKLDAMRSGDLERLLGGLDADPVPLGEVADVGAGVTLGRKLPAYGTVELPYLRVANVQDGYLDLREVKTVRVRPAEVDRYRLQSGDVLMNEGGDYDKLGRGTVWHGKIANCLYQNIVLRARPDQRRLLSQFLAAIAESEQGRRYFTQVSKQSTNIAHLGLTSLQEFPLPVPPSTSSDRSSGCSGPTTSGSPQSGRGWRSCE